jgi:hypothetical protein
MDRGQERAGRIVLLRQRQKNTPAAINGLSTKKSITTRKRLRRSKKIIVPATGVSISLSP